MNRKLNKQELQSIDEFIFKRGIHYYDLIQEMRDHIATEIENSNETNFEVALFKISNKISSEELSRILKTRTSILKKYWRKRFWNHLLDYFKFPKIIITLLLALVLMTATIKLTFLTCLLAIIAIQIKSISKLDDINYDDLLITKAFRKQINFFFILPIFFSILGKHIIGTPLHLMNNQFSISLFIYCVVSAAIIISLWACHKYFFTWVREEIESKYPEYLKLSRS